MKLELTKAEEKVMKILWDIERGLIRDIVQQCDDPKPAYTTVATIVKILEKKGFVERKPIANSFEYAPIVEKKKYTQGFIQSFVKNYFSNSYKNLVSALGQQEDMTTEEMEELIHYFQDKINDKNKQ
jgi:predicted transcriptional regulator